MGKLFGTDGIRGKALIDITEELAYNVGRALGVFKIDSLLVGSDTRDSSPILRENVVKGAKEAGLDVVDLGTISTPGLITLSHMHKTLAVMITASHNPYTDNGIKVIKCGEKIKDDDITLFENTLGTLVKHEAKSSVKVSKDEYIERLSHFNIDKNFKVVFDLSNGALSSLAHDILKNYDFDYEIINDKPDGFNINLNCGSQHLEMLKERVKLSGASIGFAFDGDADRIVACDEFGNEYSGDHLLYLLANYYKEKGLLKNNGVCLTIEANPGVDMSYSKVNINTAVSDVGDPSLFKLMKEKDYIIGAETSGHLINFLHTMTGDGILNSLIILECLSNTKKSILELTKGLEFYPIIRANLKEFDDCISDPSFINFKESLKAEANDKYAMVLVRKSGTEHLLRITVATKNEALNKSIVDRIVERVHGKY